MACMTHAQSLAESSSRGKFSVQAFKGRNNARYEAKQSKEKRAAMPVTRQGMSHVQQQQQVPALAPLQRPQHPAIQQQQQAQQAVPHLLPLPGAVAPVKQQPLPHPFCVLDHPVITHRIKQCSSWVDVAVVFAKQSQCMNAINLSALLTHLAHLKSSPSNRPVNWQTLISQVLAVSEPQLSLCAPRQLSNMAWALASLGYNSWAQHDCSWAQQWQQQLLKSLHGASCRDVTNILWALATSSSCSTDSRGSRSRRRQPLVLQQQELLLQTRLQTDLLSALHRTLSHSSPQDVSNALWALATLQLQPSSELGQYLLIRAQTHFQTLKPQEVAQSLWAISQLQLQPSTAWVQELLLRQVGRQQWESTAVQHHVMCLVACAHMRQMPPDKWIAQTLQQLEKLLLLSLVPAPQQQERHGQRDVLESYASGAEGSQCSPGYRSSGTRSHSSSSPCGISKATITSSSGGASSSSNSSRSAQDLANIIWALGVLRIRPNATWMQHYLAASRASLAASGAQDLTNTLWGLARLKPQVDAAWLEAYDAASLSKMREGGFSAQGLADVLASQLHLQLQPSGTWREEWMVALRKIWGSADASAVCKTLWAAAKFRLPLGRSWLQQALQEAHSEVHGALVRQQLSVEELLRLVYAVGRLCRGYLTQDMTDVLGLYCCRTAGKMTWQQLQRCAWGLARLNPLPRLQLVGYFAELAESKVKYMPQDQAVQVNEKLKMLKHAAELAKMREEIRQAMQDPAAMMYAHQRQQQHAEDAGKTPCLLTATAPCGVGESAACDLAQMQAALKTAQHTLQQSQKQALHRHHLQLQNKQQQQELQQKQPAAAQQPADQLAVQRVA